MLIRAPRELGAAIRHHRHHRRQRGLSQQDLASKIGVGRQWVVEIETGKARAEIGLVLRALGALGIALSIVDSTQAKGLGADGEVNIDRIIEGAKWKTR